VSGALEESAGRILGRDGVPLDLTVSLTEQEDGGTRFLVADLNLAPLTAGDYVIEVTGKATGTTEVAMLAIRVGR
jgi:hypothetical protein